MSELTFQSAGVSAREIDLTGPTDVKPSGVPAAVIGTANRGPAFVPVTVATTPDFYSKFGETDASKFGPIAVTEWLRNAQSATYLRVLGVGTGLKRAATGDNLGRVASAGFVVGSQQPTEDGNFGVNPYANDTGAGGNGPEGRTYFLGCFMSESNGSTIFSDAGIQSTAAAHPGAKARPIIRGVLLAPSGVVLTLSGARTNNSNTPLAATFGSVPLGWMTGTVNLGSARGYADFVLLLNGHKGTDPDYPRIKSASFDPVSPSYFPKVFNRDPLKIQEAGHFLYASYDIYSQLAAVTGSGAVGDNHTTWLAPDSGIEESVAFIVTGSRPRNEGSSTVPNFENFQDRFKTAASPSVISQAFGAGALDLFRVTALDDGQLASAAKDSVKLANNRYKISIQNIAKSDSEVDKYGTFDLVVRDFYDTDDEPRLLEEFRGLNLNPKSDNFVIRRIGDLNTYYNFDVAESDQRLVVAGIYPNVSNYIRVSMSETLQAGEVPSTALPVGFRGPFHLVTSGSGIIQTVPASGSMSPADWYNTVVQPPAPLRSNLTIGASTTKRLNSALHWGTQFERQTDATQPNKSDLPNDTVASFTRYFPDFQTSNRNVVVGENAGTADVTGTILDCDRFNNNIFTLERVQVKTGSNTKADSTTVEDWSYKRAGGIVANSANKTRAWSIVTDFAIVGQKRLRKFSFFVQNGFDGVDLRDKNTLQLDNKAVKDEMTFPARGQSSGPTVKAYKKALQVVGSTADVEIQLLAIPGIRHAVISNDAITTVEDRFDAMYIMDIEERNDLNFVITSSADQPNVENTVNSFTSRALNTSFAAAYFPDVVLPDPVKGTLIQVPPSVAVLGAFSLNDKIGHPWFAPAGFTRGSLRNVSQASVTLKRENLDQLYSADINPLVAFPNEQGVVVFGQKTLQVAQSALDRVNVRRLLIEIRRKVRKVADRLLFEPNRESTLSKFSALVNPLLKRIQDQQGLDRFKVIIDTTTTTQTDIENNTVRGKIFLQPTRTAEFVSLDFVITNAGTEI